MAGTDRLASPDMTSELKLDLLKEGYSFSFFQAMRLLRLLSRKSPADQTGVQIENEAVRIRPALSLGFPKADIDRIEEAADDEDDRFFVTANFLGLYGSSSPLPAFYTEDLMEETSEDESAARDFIDIINHRLYELFYGCCTKYRQVLAVAEFGSSTHMERLFCLLGIGGKSLRSKIDNPMALLRYVGLFTQMPRSAMGLETILKDVLKGMAVSVIPCVAHKAKIPPDQRLALGSSRHGLGENCVLGQEIEDRMGKFKIQVGPLDKTGFQRFYPGAEAYSRISFLTEMYIMESLSYDLEVILAEGEAQTACLGDPERSKIGLNTWIFSSDRIEEVRKVYRPAMG